jgi:hypothetical protein
MNRTNSSYFSPPNVKARAGESQGEPELSGSATESGYSTSAETDETVSPVGDQPYAVPGSRAIVAHDAVSEICDADGTADAGQYGVAGLRQSQIMSLEQTGADQQPASTVVRVIVEHDGVDVPNVEEISPGKFSLSKEDYSIVLYAASIGESWRRAWRTSWKSLASVPKQVSA